MDEANDRHLDQLIEAAAKALELPKATAFSAADAFAGIYRVAEIKRAVEPVLRGIDALAVPTAPCMPTLAEIRADPLGPNARRGLRPLRGRHPGAARHRHAAARRRHAAQGIPVRTRGRTRRQGHLIVWRLAGLHGGAGLSGRSATAGVPGVRPLPELPKSPGSASCARRPRSWSSCRRSPRSYPGRR